MTGPDDIRAGDVDWQVGDIAICVASRLDPCKRRGIYRVERVLVGLADDGDYGLGLVLVGVRPEAPMVGFWAACFDKLLPAEPCFTEALRSFVEPEPTNPDLVAELHALGFGRF